MRHVRGALLCVVVLLSVTHFSDSMRLERACPDNSWCEGRIAAACPVGSRSAANSTRLSDCVCKDGTWSQPLTNASASGRSIHVETESIQRWDALHDGLQLRLGRPGTRRCQSKA
eukprot:3932726-Rhodomonas_salina.1